MTEYDWVQLISVVGFLVLAGSALASHRLSLRKGLVMALAWGSIFLAAFLVFDLIRG